MKARVCINKAMDFGVCGNKLINTGVQEISCHLRKYSFSKEDITIIMVTRNFLIT
jgi:hypothetical protein